MENGKGKTMPEDKPKEDKELTDLERLRFMHTEYHKFMDSAEWFHREIMRMAMDIIQKQDKKGGE